MCIRFAAKKSFFWIRTSFRHNLLHFDRKPPIIERRIVI